MDLNACFIRMLFNQTNNLIAIANFFISLQILDFKIIIAQKSNVEVTLLSTLYLFI
jgi:hypothetical protein